MKSLILYVGSLRVRAVLRESIGRFGCFFRNVIVKPFLIEGLFPVFGQSYRYVFSVVQLSELERGAAFGAAYFLLVCINELVLYWFSVNVIQRGFLFFVFSVIYLLYLVFERAVFRFRLYEFVWPNGTLLSDAEIDEDRSIFGYFFKVFLFLLFEQLVVSMPFVVSHITMTLTIDLPLAIRFGLY